MSDDGKPKKTKKKAKGEPDHSVDGEVNPNEVGKVKKAKKKTTEDPDDAADDEVHPDEVSKPKRAKKKTKDDPDDAADDEVSPRPRRSGDATGTKKKTSKKKGDGVVQVSDDDVPDDDLVVKRTHKASNNKKKGRVVQVDDDDEVSDDEVVVDVNRTNKTKTSNKKNRAVVVQVGDEVPQELKDAVEGAREEIFNMLAKDSFNRFKLQDEFQALSQHDDYLKAYQGKSGNALLPTTFIKELVIEGADGNIFRKALMTFLKTEFSSENLTFLLHVNKLKGHENEYYKYMEVFHYIYVTFISENAPKSVNIAYQQRKKLTTMFADYYNKVDVAVVERVQESRILEGIKGVFVATGVMAKFMGTVEYQKDTFREDYYGMEEGTHQLEYCYISLVSRGRGKFSKLCHDQHGSEVELLDLYSRCISLKSSTFSATKYAMIIHDINKKFIEFVTADLPKGIEAQRTELDKKIAKHHSIRHKEFVLMLLDKVNRQELQDLDSHVYKRPEVH